MYRIFFIKILIFNILCVFFYYHWISYQWSQSDRWNFWLHNSKVKISIRMIVSLYIQRFASKSNFKKAFENLKLYKACFMLACRWRLRLNFEHTKSNIQTPKVIRNLESNEIHRFRTLIVRFIEYQKWYICTYVHVFFDNCPGVTKLSIDSIMYRIFFFSFFCNILHRSGGAHQSEIKINSDYQFTMKPTF